MEYQQREPPSMEYIQKCQIELQRNFRNELLEKSDRYMLSDYPLTDDQKNEIKVYRQALRDYFSRDDVINWTYDKELPAFPTVPSFVK